VCFTALLVYKLLTQGRRGFLLLLLLLLFLFFNAQGGLRPVDCDSQVAGSGSPRGADNAVRGVVLLRLHEAGRGENLALTLSCRPPCVVG
jgi:hypothetical protein